MNLSGVYEIRNAANGKRYIGSSVNLLKRGDKHFRQLRRGNHHSIVLQRAFNKYGEDSFMFRVLTICDSTNLLFFEQRALDNLKPEYNLLTTAGSSLGYKTSQETKEKLCQLNLGKYVSLKTREKLMGNKNAVGLIPWNKGRFLVESIGNRVRVYHNKKELNHG